jgi:hypothetical protein
MMYIDTGFPFSTHLLFRKEMAKFSAGFFFLCPYLPFPYGSQALPLLIPSISRRRKICIFDIAYYTAFFLASQYFCRTIVLFLELLFSSPAHRQLLVKPPVPVKTRKQGMSTTSPAPERENNDSLLTRT